MSLTLCIEALLAAAGAAGTWALARMAARRPLAAFLALQCWYVSIQFLLESVLADKPLATATKELLTAVFLLGAIQQWLAYPGGRQIRIRGFVFLATASIGCATAAAILSPDLTRAVAALRFFALYPALMFAGIAMRHEVAASPRSVIRFLRQFVLLGAVVSAFGLLSYQFHGLIDPRWQTSAATMNAVTQRSGIATNAVVSTLGNRSNMGGFAVLILLMALATRHVIFRRKLAPLAFLGCGLVALALVLTFSRTAYIGLAVGGLLLFLAEKRPNLKILITAAVVLAGVVAAVDALAPESLDSALNSIMDTTLSGRSTVWNEIADKIPDSPFGSGLGVYGKELRGFGADHQIEGLGAVDNSILLIIVEQGVHAGLLWILLFVAIGVRAFKNLRGARTALGLALARMVWAWYGAFVAMCITIDWFHALPVICPLWFFFGLQFALPALERAWISRNAHTTSNFSAIGQAGGFTQRDRVPLAPRRPAPAAPGNHRIDVPRCGLRA